MRPIQVWLPTLITSLGWPGVQRDMRRAFEAWRGEFKVWLLPELKEAVRWSEGDNKIKLLGVSSEHVECVDVYHVGKNRQVVGPGSGERFPNGRIDGLLDAWLNVVNDSGMKLYPAPKEFTWRVPFIDGRKVEYKNVTFHTQPGPTLPVVGVEENARRAKIVWPPKERSPLPVSPEVESSEFYGPLRRVDRKGVPIAVSGSNSNFRSLHLITQWPEPLGALLPSGGGVDDIFGQAEMAQIAEQSADDLEGALRKARDAAALYVTEGHTTQQLAWFLPTLMQEGKENLLFDLERRFGMTFNTLDEAVQSTDMVEHMLKPVPIRRAWGVLGLCWALLLDKLEDGKAYRVCKLCDRIIAGKRGKQFCGPNDHQACYLNRRAGDRRRERSRIRR